MLPEAGWLATFTVKSAASVAVGAPRITPAPESILEPDGPLLADAAYVDGGTPRGMRKSTTESRSRRVHAAGSPAATAGRRPSPKAGDRYVCVLRPPIQLIPILHDR